MSDSVRPHRWQPIRLLCPWDSPGKNTGVGCHFLLHGELLLPLKGSEGVRQIQASVGNVRIGDGSEKCRLEPTCLLPQNGLPGMGWLLDEGHSLPRDVCGGRSLVIPRSHLPVAGKCCLRPTWPLILWIVSVVQSCLTL